MAQPGLISRKRNTTEAVTSDYRSTEACDIDVFCQVGHALTFPTTRLPSLLELSPLLSCMGVKPPWGTRFPFHTLHTGSLSFPCHVTSPRKPSLMPFTRHPQANIYTDHTQKHERQRSGAQPPKPTCLGSNVDSKLYILYGLGQVINLSGLHAITIIVPTSLGF